MINNYCIENIFDAPHDKIAHIPYTKEFYASLEILRCGLCDVL